MTVNFEKVKAEMSEHWDMDAATFDAHTVNQKGILGDGWKEIVFKDADGNDKFYIEVNEDSEVWHFDYI